MDKEEALKLKLKALTGELSDEDMRKIIMYTGNSTIKKQEESGANNKQTKVMVKSNGKSLLEKENINNRGISNIIYLSTISLVMEVAFLLAAILIFN